MRLLLNFLILSILFVSNINDNVDNKTIRELFHNAQSEEDLDLLLRHQVLMNGTIAKSYFGSALAMKAQYPFSPIKKYKYFLDGTKLIENSIEEQQFVENTYLRLLIQLNTPRFLGYHHNIQEDINFIENHIDGSPLAIKWKITMLEKILLFESDDYSYSGLKEKLIIFSAL